MSEIHKVLCTKQAFQNKDIHFIKSVRDFDKKNTSSNVDVISSRQANSVLSKEQNQQNNVELLIKNFKDTVDIVKATPENGVGVLEYATKMKKVKFFLEVVSELRKQMISFFNSVINNSA